MIFGSPVEGIVILYRPCFCGGRKGRENTEIGTLTPGGKCGEYMKFPEVQGSKIKRFSYAFFGYNTTGIYRLLKCLIIAFRLIGVGHSEISDCLAKNITFADIS